MYAFQNKGEIGTFKTIFIDMYNNVVQLLHASRYKVKLSFYISAI